MLSTTALYFSRCYSLALDVWTNYFKGLIHVCLEITFKNNNVGVQHRSSPSLCNRTVVLQPTVNYTTPL